LWDGWRLEECKGGCTGEGQRRAETYPIKPMGVKEKLKSFLILSKNLKITHLIFADVSLVRLKLRYSFPTLKYSLKKLVYKKDFCSLCSDLHKDLMGGSPGYIKL
jgi:hypothetical protein